MQGLRDLLRDNLGRSLRALPDHDRLEAAWTVACGAAMASRGRIVAFEEGTLRVQVESDLWLPQFRQLGPVLCAELTRIAGVRVTGIHFVGAFRRTAQRERDNNPSGGSTHS